MANYNLTHTWQNVDDATEQAIQTADFVVEQGESGIWTYRKWNSGIAECWLTAGYMTSGTPTTMTANGVLYESNTMTLSLPSGLFAATPNVSIDTMQAAGMWFKATGETTNASIAYQMLRTNNTKAAARLSCQCKGRWR